MLSRLALMGTTKGPCVSCRGIRNPHVKVSGLPENGEVRARMSNGKTLVIPSNGLHSTGFPLLEWVEVSCTVSNRHTIVEVVSAKAA